MTDSHVPPLLHRAEFQVSFGDCDPAGIVFYPNFFRWSDALFHSYLAHVQGGHIAICEMIGARGLGVMEASISFRSPAAPGDRLEFGLKLIDWSERSFTVHYAAQIEGRVVCEGREVRGVFVEVERRLRAGSTQGLRKILEPGGKASEKLPTPHRELGTR